MRSPRTRRALLLGLAFSTVGCGGGLQLTRADASTYARPAAADYPDADAVHLVREHRGFLVSNYNGDKDRSQWSYRRVTLILTEAGQSAADARISFPDEAKLTAFTARTITEDGRQIPVPRSALHDDEGRSGDDDGYRVRVFTFPEANVGALLEMEYVIEYPWIFSTRSRYVTSDYPTQEYRVSIEGPRDVYYKVQSYHAAGASPWQVEGSGAWRLTWGMSDVPAESDVAYDGPRAAREPFWVFSVQAFVNKGRVTHRNSTWDSAVKSRAKALYQDDDAWAGFDVKVEPACPSVRCRVGAALAWVTENLPLRGFSGWPGKKPREVLDAKEASALEKATVVHRLLEDLDVEARFAFYHAYQGGYVDEDLPNVSDLPRVVLKVPAQGDLLEDLWVDPGCEYCALSERPYWLTDTRALVVDYRYDDLSTTPTYTGRFEPVGGAARPPSSFRLSYDVEVAPETGDVEVRATTRFEGKDAQSVRRKLRERDADEWRSRAQKFARARTAQAVVSDWSAPTVDTEAWTGAHHRGWSAKGYAVRDGDTLVVPLSLMSFHFDDAFEAAERDVDVVVSFPYDVTEEVRLRIPEGFQVRRLPETRRAEGPFTVEVSASQADGVVRIRRRIQARLGVHPVAIYPQVRAALELFRSARDRALELVVAPPAPEPTPGGPK